MFAHSAISRRIMALCINPAGLKRLNQWMPVSIDFSHTMPRLKSARPVPLASSKAVSVYHLGARNVERIQSRLTVTVLSSV